MKTIIDGIEVEGTPQEIIELIKAQGNSIKTLQQKTNTDRAIEIITQAKTPFLKMPYMRRKRKNARDYSEIFKKAKDLMTANKDLALTTALKQAANVTHSLGGKVNQKFQQYLKGHYTTDNGQEQVVQTKQRVVPPEYNTRYKRIKELVLSGMPLGYAYKEIYGRQANKDEYAVLKTKLLEDGIKYKRPDTSSAEHKIRLSSMSKIAYEEAKASGRKYKDVIKEKAYMLRKNPKVPIDTASYDQFAIRKATEPLVLEFPKFHTVDEKWQVPPSNVLENMIKNCIANNGKMTYYVEGQMLELTRPHEWQEFIAEFMRKSREILAVFNTTARGHFVIQKLGGKNEIVYRGGDYNE